MLSNRGHPLFAQQQTQKRIHGNGRDESLQEVKRHNKSMADVSFETDSCYGYPLFAVAHTTVTGGQPQKIQHSKGLSLDMMNTEALQLE